MPERPHISFPVELAGGRIAEVEQDSDREVGGCIAVILGWPIGTRPDLPDFGVPVESFLSGGPDLQEIRQAVQRSEPRNPAVRDALIDANLKGGLAEVLVGFDQTVGDGE
jgi:hypothetical protein